VAVADEEQMMAYYNIPCWYMVERKRKLVVDEIRRMADYVRRNQDDKSQWTWLFLHPTAIMPMMLDRISGGTIPSTSLKIF
jgi:hypothetical protein